MLQLPLAARLRATLAPRTLTGAAGMIGASSAALPLPALDVKQLRVSRAAVPARPVAAAPFSATAVRAAPGLPSGGAASYGPTCVLVKVGDVGKYSEFTLSWEALAAMRDTGLLEALCETRAFGPLFKDVALAACRVYILKGELPEDKEEPDAADEAPSNVLEVKGATTLGQAAKAAGCTGDNLFIRVTLPGTEPSVLMDRSLSQEAAIAAFSPTWRQAAQSLMAARKQLADVPMLHLKPTDKPLPISVSEAKKLKVTPLYPAADSAADSRLKLGVFSLPSLVTDATACPKGYELSDLKSFFFDEQRTALALEFLGALDAQKRAVRKYGVLLSGPNGVGKSSVGLQVFLMCFAQGIPLVYFTNCIDWVRAAMDDRGEAYFLEQLLLQNADLIAADADLRAALAPALQGGELGYKVMSSLLAVLSKRPGPAIGIVADEVQTITHAVEAGKAPGALPPAVTAAIYFKQWTIWDTSVQVFCRMDIASSHGMRELQLPSGEEHRLRIIKPWSAPVVDAAIRTAGSPLCFGGVSESTLQRIVFIAGGVPGALFVSKTRFDSDVKAGMSESSALKDVERHVAETMRLSCSTWFSGLTDAEKRNVFAIALPLIRGQVTWDAVKGLYDGGLVARMDDSAVVSPVSHLATTVIMQQLGTASKTRSRG